MELDILLPKLLCIAWLLPLASFVIILFFGPRLGKHGYLASYVATGAILGSFALSFISFCAWLGTEGQHSPVDHHVDSHAEVAQVDSHGHPVPSHEAHGPDAHGNDEHGHDGHAHDAAHPVHKPTAFTGTWYLLAKFGNLPMTISYYIDALTICMFTMVTLIASCIHFYASGYMHDELHDITDHEVIVTKGRAHAHGHSHGNEAAHEEDTHGHSHADVGHHHLPKDKEYLTRPGRFHRFFQYLSLFCFSMLGLVVAGNIAMVFVFWELVGV